MDPKGANLASTDLLEISELVSGSYVTKSITGAEIIASVPASVTAWGTITGTLSAQTDLNTALSGKVPTSRTLTINGTTQDLSADRTFTVSTGITIGTTAITSGTVGRVLFEGTGNVVQESAGLTWNEATQTFQLTNGGIIQIGTNLSMTANASELTFKHGGTNIFKIRSTQVIIEMPIQFTSGGNPATIRNAFSNTGIQIAVNGSNLAGVSTYFATSGNVLIGTATDAGFKLDVNGTARVSDTLTLSSSTTALSMFSAALTFTQSGGARFINFVNGGITFNNTYAFTIANGSNIPLTATGTDVYIGSQTNNGLFLQRNSAYVYTLNKLNGGNDVSNTFDIRTGDYTSSAFSSSSGNIRIYSGDNTGTGGGGFGNLILQHNGTVKRGNVLIGTTTNVASAIVNVQSTTQGFLPPRMTTTQKNAIASPTAGLVVYDTTLNKLCVYTTTWETITSL